MKKRKKATSNNPRAWIDERTLVAEWWEVRRIDRDGYNEFWSWVGAPDNLTWNHRPEHAVHFDSADDARDVCDGTGGAVVHVKRWSRPKKPGETDACPVHDDQHHGLEAEELRLGIEDALEQVNADEQHDPAHRVLANLTERLRDMVDEVDARDALAWGERQDRAKRRPKVQHAEERRKGGGT